MNEIKKVLVIDDEPDAIEFVKAVLEELGSFRVIPAYEGKEGLEQAKIEIPDLILLDIMMPEKDGFQVFYELRQGEETKDIPVIMLTGVADKSGIRFFKDDMKNYMGYEPIDYIEKPLNPERLKSAVSNVLQPGSAI